ncbi:MAG TPA: hypothetical protein V6D25_08790 [Leptolyngbyaceae cyanobacterium]
MSYNGRKAIAPVQFNLLCKVEPILFLSYEEAVLKFLLRKAQLITN